VADELTPSELDELVSALEVGLHRTAGGFNKGTMFLGGLYLLIVVSFVTAKAWGVAAIALAFGAGFVALGRLAAKRTSPDRMKPVCDAVRDAPGDVTWVRHYTTSDSLRLFVKHWLEIKTSSHRFVMQAPKWEHLIDLLKRRCPGATFVD